MLGSGTTSNQCSAIANAIKTSGVNDASALTGTVSGLQGTSDAVTVAYASTGSAASADVGTYAITASVTFSPSKNAADYIVATAGQSGGTADFALALGSPASIGRDAAAAVDG